MATGVEWIEGERRSCEGKGGEGVRGTEIAGIGTKSWEGMKRSGKDGDG